MVLNGLEMVIPLFSYFDIMLKPLLEAVIERTESFYNILSNFIYYIILAT